MIMRFTRELHEVENARWSLDEELQIRCLMFIAKNLLKTIEDTDDVDQEQAS